MKTTIYELLGMIKDNKAPKKILFKEQIYEYTRTGYYDSDNGETLFDTYYIDEILNDEVEILETTIIYKQDNIKNNKQEETPICKRIDGEWYTNKEMAKWLDKQYSSILDNKQDKIGKLNLNLFTKSDVAYYFGNKINEIIEAINENK